MGMPRAHLPVENCHGSQSGWAANCVLRHRPQGATRESKGLSCTLAPIPLARINPARSPRSRPLASIPPTLTDPARLRRSRSLASIPLARIDAAHGFSIPLIHCLPLHECRPFETGLTTLTSGHTTLTLVT